MPLCPSISLARGLRTLQQHDSLCDLTLIADDHKRVHVHKAVFASMSGYLQKRLKNKQPCDSFILTGISVEGIRSLTEFIYGNVYAIHCNNVEEVYPLAKLFEFDLMCKVAEYIDPSVKYLDWTNKVIPVSPNLLSRRPNKPSPSRKVEEKNSAQGSDDRDGEEDGAVKRKRTGTKSPTPKVQQSKRMRKDAEDDNEKIDEPKHDAKKGKASKDQKDSGTDVVKKPRGFISNGIETPLITRDLKVKLERIDYNSICEKLRNKSSPPSPEKVERPEKDEQAKEGSEKLSEETKEGSDKLAEANEGSEKLAEATKEGSEKLVEETKEGSEKLAEETKEGSEKPAEGTKEGSEKLTEGMKEGPDKLSESSDSNEDSSDEEPSSATEKIDKPSDDNKENNNNGKCPTKETKPDNEQGNEDLAKRQTPDKGKGDRKKPSPKKQKALEEETVFECGKCKVLFTSLEKCNEHMAKAHNVAMVSVNKNYICSTDSCGFKCGDAETLKKHVVVEHPLVFVKKTQVWHL